MENIKNINFFDDKDKKNSINKYRIIILSTILMILIVDNMKIYEVKGLENQVFQRKQVLENTDENKVVNKDQVHIKEIYKLIQLIQDNNIQTIEIDNDKLNIKGQVQNSEQIKQYLDLLHKVDTIKNPSISSINRINDMYEFEINASVGVKSEN
ncbi:MAG: hypothetical protein RR765_05000 [Peptostreptococcaceae bacterium]